MRDAKRARRNTREKGKKSGELLKFCEAAFLKEEQEVVISIGKGRGGKEKKRNEMWWGFGLIVRGLGLIRKMAREVEQTCRERGKKFSSYLQGKERPEGKSRKSTNN